MSRLGGAPLHFGRSWHTWRRQSSPRRSAHTPAAEMSQVIHQYQNAIRNQLSTEG